MVLVMHKLVPTARWCGWAVCLALAGYSGIAAAQQGAAPIAPGESRLSLPDAVEAPAPNATPAVQPSVEDVATGTALRALLASDQAIPADRINVSVAGGVATLRGSVPSLFARDRAIELAQSMRGIERVENLLAVAGPARGDDAVLRDVTAVLTREPGIAAMNIGVGVQDGTVTLSGTVDRWQTQQHVSELVKAVPGVQAINSRITFTTSNQPDDQILAQVQRRLMEDDSIQPGSVRASVENGTVRLSGTVGSVMERNRAITDAWVDGVNGVAAEALRVDVAARGEMIRPAASAVPTDQEIRGALSNAFAYSNTLISFDPEIRVANGVVTLDGVVNSEEDKREAETIAASVPGVQSVQNELEVRGVNGAGTAPGTTTTTAMRPGATSVSTADRVDTGTQTSMPDDGTLPPLVAQFRDLVNEDPELQSYQLSSTVADDGFRVYGIVDSKAKKDRAERLAASLPGVDKVISKIRVSENWQVTDQGMRPSDPEILQAIQQALAWNPYIDLSAITIRVNKGVVTLDGSVENWRDSNMASRAALLSGAVDVRNNLRVGVTASQEAQQIAAEEAQAGGTVPMQQNQTVAVVPGAGSAGAQGTAAAPGAGMQAGGVPMTGMDEGFDNVDVVAVPGGGGVLVPGVVGTGTVDPGTGLNRDISQVAPTNVPVDDGTATTNNPAAAAPGAAGVPGAGGSDPDVAAVPGSAGLTAPGADQVTNKSAPANTAPANPAPGQTNPVPAPTTPAPAPSSGTSGGSGAGGGGGK